MNPHRTAVNETMDSGLHGCIEHIPRAVKINVPHFLSRNLLPEKSGDMIDHIDSLGGPH
jgi:hypothetical protein